MTESIRNAAIETLGDVYVAGNKTKPKYSGFDAMSCHDDDPISVYALKMAYRKHAKNDDSIGWDELHDILGNALAQIMGDVEFVEWNESRQSNDSKPNHVCVCGSIGWKANCDQCIPW